jgi:hypothetical protein
MRRTQAAGRVEAQSTKNTILNTAPLACAVRIIHQVCCLAGSFDLLEEFHDQDLCTAIERHDTAAIFDRLMHDFSFQGISDETEITELNQRLARLLSSIFCLAFRLVLCIIRVLQAMVPAARPR